MSLRTCMLIWTGVCILLASLTSGSALFVHFALVCFFGLPGASIGYDRTEAQRGAIAWGCAAAILGTVTVSAVVLVWDFGKMWVSA
ncbi:MAG TPA: hypothetical protein EYG57_12515 [Planctomycetes bacterium]|jgi:hypothetical protein|nr:hypothetical protein [Planctomycetaceae bacterium]HIM30352.1 hypothetical protein [Planctomycetota bacterium]